MSDPRPPVLSVSDLTAILKETLEAAFPSLWVGGEITDIARPRSGHIYLTLKDDQSQIRAVIWRSTVVRLPFELKDGMEVICQGGLDLYPPRGSYQLVVRQVEPVGVGAQQLVLQKLKAKLAAEGLFAAERKRPLPRFPRRIAFVTSPTGAAIRDFCEVLRRRWRGVEVIVIPARVQGEGASSEIADGIGIAQAIRPPVDVLVVGRGGGSVEDLWCFNDEAVVRAIADSPIPVVSAVGHEIDVTLSDLAADVRALTPSEAAERIVPSADELMVGLQAIERRLAACLRARLSQARGRVEAAMQSRVLRQPLDMTHDRARRLDELEQRMGRAILARHQLAQQSVNALASRLESLSPLAVLARGYSLTERVSDGALVRRTDQVAPGDPIRIRLTNGQLTARIE